MQAHILEADLLVQSALDSLKSGMEGSFDSGYCTSPVRIAAGMQLTIYVNFYLIKKKSNHCLQHINLDCIRKDFSQGCIHSV